MHRHTFSIGLENVRFMKSNLYYTHEQWKRNTQNIHQYLKDILNLLSQRTSDDFMTTKDGHHMDFISLKVNCPNVYTHAHIKTVVQNACSESKFASLA